MKQPKGQPRPGGAFYRHLREAVEGSWPATKRAEAFAFCVEGQVLSGNGSLVKRLTARGPVGAGAGGS